MIVFIAIALGSSLWFWVKFWRLKVAPHITVDVAFSKSSIPHGDSCELVVTLRNPTRFPAPLVTCSCELPNTLSLASAEESTVHRKLSFTVSVRAREQVTARYQVYGVQRGQRTTTRVALSQYNGFTFAEEYQMIPVPQTITVHPKRTSVSVSTEMAAPLGPMPYPRKLFSSSLDWIDLRPYQTGDSIRDISWMTSARRGELMVLERASTMAKSVIVVVSAQCDAKHWRYDESIASEVYAVVYAVLIQLLQEGAEFMLYSNAYWPTSSRVPTGTMVMRAEGPWNSVLDFGIGHELGAVAGNSQFPLVQVLEDVMAQTWFPSQIIVISSYEDDDIHHALTQLSGRGHQVELLKVPSLKTDDLTDGSEAHA